MAKGFQKTMLIGNLGAEPSERLRVVNTANGSQSVLTIGVAVTERKGAEPEWFNCTFWGSLADALVQYGAKGATVHVETHRRTTTRETDEGVKKYEEYVVESLNILTYKGDSGRSSGEEVSTPAPAPRTQQSRQTYQAPAPRRSPTTSGGQGRAPQAPRRAQANPGYDASEALGFGPEEDFQ